MHDGQQSAQRFGACALEPILGVMARDAMDIWREEMGQPAHDAGPERAFGASGDVGFTLGNTSGSKPPPGFKASWTLRRDPTVGMREPGYIVRGAVVGFVGALALILFAGVREHNFVLLVILPVFAAVTESRITRSGLAAMMAAFAAAAATAFTAAFALPLIYLLDFFNCWASWLSDC